MDKHVQRELAEAEGLTVECKEFSDCNTPNPAVRDGAIEANLFQNTTFLETYNKASGKNLVSVGKVYLPPMAEIRHAAAGGRQGQRLLQVLAVKAEMKDDPGFRGSTRS